MGRLRMQRCYDMPYATAEDMAASYRCCQNVQRTRTDTSCSVLADDLVKALQENVKEPVEQNDSEEVERLKD
jgi:hypothetical protein